MVLGCLEGQRIPAIREAQHGRIRRHQIHANSTVSPPADRRVGGHVTAEAEPVKSTSRSWYCGSAVTCATDRHPALRESGSLPVHPSAVLRHNRRRRPVGRAVQASRRGDQLDLRQVRIGRAQIASASFCLAISSPLALTGAQRIEQRQQRIQLFVLRAAAGTVGYKGDKAMPRTLPWMCGQTGGGSAEGAIRVFSAARQRSQWERRAAPGRALERHIGTRNDEFRSCGLST